MSTFEKLYLANNRPAFTIAFEEMKRASSKTPRDRLYPGIFKEYTRISYLLALLYKNLIFAAYSSPLPVFEEKMLSPVSSSYILA